MNKFDAFIGPPMSDIVHTSLHTPAHTEQGWVIADPLAHPAAAKVREQAKAQV